MRGMAMWSVIEGWRSVQGVDMAGMTVARIAVARIAVARIAVAVIAVAVIAVAVCRVAMRMACRPGQCAGNGADGSWVAGGKHPVVI